MVDRIRPAYAVISFTDTFFDEPTVVFLPYGTPDGVAMKEGEISAKYNKLVFITNINRFWEDGKQVY